jgi:hypothetical protein
MFPARRDIGELADKMEIEEVLITYARLVATRRAELVADVFSETAGFESGTRVLRGIAELQEFFAPALDRSRVTSLDTTIVSMPLVTNIAIEINGDVATCVSYCLAVHAGYRSSSGTVVVRGTENTDELARTASGWRIQYRRHLRLFSFDSPGTLSRH